MNDPGLCLDCGKPPKPPRRRLTRGRCGTCYFRNLRRVRAAAKPVQTVADRLFAKATAGPGNCLIWTGALNDGGYGLISIDGRNRRAHRVAYEQVIGPIPDGMELDHTCHNQDDTCPGGRCLHRRCVNPHHLEPVSKQENALRSKLTRTGRNVRRTHCPKGHPYSGENLYVDPTGRRACRACQAAHWAATDKEAYNKRRLAQKIAARNSTVPCGHPRAEDGAPCTRAIGHSGRHDYKPRRTTT
jgi:hypothetical protein